MCGEDVGVAILLGLNHIFQFQPAGFQSQAVFRFEPIHEGARFLQFSLTQRLTKIETYGTVECAGQEKPPSRGKREVFDTCG